MLKLLVKTLRNFSATDVRETRDLNVAQDMIRDRLPEVIFLGLAPNRIDEVDFLRELGYGSDAPSKYTSVIVLHDVTCVKEVAAAIELGFESSITIPFCLGRFEATLLEALGNSY